MSSPPARSQTFTYDTLNRISSALTTSTHATSPAHCWGENYSVDAWGNLQSISQTTNSNYTGCTAESGFSATADGNNHFTSFSYDASGNTQNDGTFGYTWDGESQLKSAEPARKKTRTSANAPGAQKAGLKPQRVRHARPAEVRKCGWPLP